MRQYLVSPQNISYRISLNENGGNADEWKMESPKSTDVVKKDGYDVIVVGLGSSGISSYLSAASNGAAVFGMDSAAKDWW